MIYLFRFIAACVALATGVAAEFFMVLALDKPALLLLAMPLLAAFIVLLVEIEPMGRQLHKWWKGFGR